MSVGQHQGYADNGNAFNSPYFIRIRGLPWSTTKRDILNFFHGVHILNGEDGIHLITLALTPNRPLGEAYIQLATQRDLEMAHNFDRKNLGSRYIEVFDAHVEDFLNILSKQQHVNEERILRLRGLPWNATKQDIANFFHGLELCETDIHIHYDRDGRASGEAYAQFRSIDDCQEAMRRNMGKLGHRYIEIFTSTAQQLHRSIMQTMEVQGQNRNRNADGNDHGGNSGPMRTNRNNRNNMCKPYSSDDSGYRGRCEMNSTNQLGGLFSEFDDRRGSRSGNRSFSNDRNGGFQNQQTDKPFSRRNNNDTNNRFNSPTQSGNRFNDFQRDHRQNDRWMGFKPDYGSAGFFSNNGHASNRSDFGGNVYGSNGNGNGNGSGNGFGANRSNMSDINTVHLVLIRGMPFYCDEMDVCNFFAPIKPIHCKVILNEKGRHTGKAEVYFGSRDDVALVMRKNREKMGSRYIELFDANENRRSRF